MFLCIPRRVPVNRIACLHFPFSCLPIKFLTCSALCLWLALGLTMGLTACTPSPPPPFIWNPELNDVDEGGEQIVALKKRAAQDPQAAYDLALRYFRGDGVQRNNHQAIFWMRAAAEKGDLAAQKALGALYMTGLETVGRDPDEAHAWLSLAVSRGDSDSQQLLAEAEAAKRSKEHELRWYRRWHPIIYDWWWYRYPYYYRWWHGRWYLY